MRVLSSAFITALTFVGGTYAWFRLPCTEPLVQVRSDPIISPGRVPSNHVHTVHGAKNFRSDSTFASLRASSCTSCKVTQDLSNYWFPKLYFRDPKTGLFEAVGNGGLLVYYLQRGDDEKLNGGPGLKAFPEGFKMISGNPVSRSKKFPTETGSQAELRERATKWACLRYSVDLPQSEGYGWPTTDCETGFQARLHFPSCWDGKNVDSADHMSHVAYLSGLDNGSCPDTHPVTLMHMFYEVTWDVHAFADRWTAADGWPFVWANGDPTGYGWHGDFQNGWDVDVLQTAIDKCNDPSNDTINGVVDACSYLTVQPDDTALACKATPEVDEPVSGTLSKLPGCNPLQYGPGDATLYSDSNCPV